MALRMSASNIIEEAAAYGVDKQARQKDSVHIFPEWWYVVLLTALLILACKDCNHTYTKDDLLAELVKKIDEGSMWDWVLSSSMLNENR
uniref:Transmembrane protein n=1 Tax=Steinernema glaseri TaxID=37863 RepID=A0A1I8AGC5_9BILA